jgi:putative chitinase
MTPATLTAPQLATATGATVARAELLLRPLQDAMQRYAINTPLRMAMFLPNVGHESGGLQWLSERWGPTPAQAAYEGRADLGNTQPGDGKKYRGRGLLQTTGRANFRALRDRLRAQGLDCPDFEAAPDTVALPQWAALSAGDYVSMRKLNDKADAGDFLGYCIGINGRNRATGLPNGWDDRQRLYAWACKVLGVAA